MFGKLTWQAIPFHEPIPLVSGLAVYVALLAVLAWVIRKGYWPYVWREWITITSASASCTACWPA